MKGRRAFTLVEMLIVLAIILVLAAVIYVAMAPARESASQSQCISNLRQIGQAVALYRQDEGSPPGGRIPAGANVLSSLGVPNNPWSLYPNYIRDLRLFHCPDDRAVASNPLTCSYSWCALSRDPETAKLGAALFREKGEEIPVALDEIHATDYYGLLKTGGVPARSRKWPLLILRLSGSVQKSKKPMPDGGNCIQ